MSKAYPVRAVLTWLVVLLAAGPAEAGWIPVDLAELRAQLEANKDRVTAICARSHPIPKAVALTVHVTAGSPYAGEEHGRIELAATSDDDFGACFATEAHWHLRAGQYTTKPFSGTVTLKLRPPDELLSRALAAWFATESTCIPRPGEIPRAVTIDIASDEADMTIHATTSPANDAVDTCMAASLRASLDLAGIGPGRSNPTAHLTRALPPLVTSKRLRAVLPELARVATASCLPEEDDKPPKATMTVSVTAKVDAQDFVVTAHSGDAKRDACTEDALLASLHERFARQLDDGTTFFRIDGNATRRYAFAIETTQQIWARWSAERAATFRD
jgi:hypothetical protein